MQSIWRHLMQEDTPAQQKAQEEGDEQNPVDNGERIVVAHLRVFMAAILGFETG